MVVLLRNITFLDEQ